MDKTSNKYQALCIYLVLALTTLAVFWQARHHEFITFDDDVYIVDNTQVKAGLTTKGLLWAFTSTHAYNWHPLTWLSHMLDCQFYGLEPGGHHFTNVLFHTANAILLLLVLNRMTGNFWASAFVAAAFALHPLHVESVAWASERKDVLSTFFWMLTMWAYVCYLERPNVKRYLVMLLTLALGLMAKQMLVTLPFVLLLLDYWPLRRFTFKGQSHPNSSRTEASLSARRCILEKLPLLILSAVAALVVYLVQQQTGVMKSIVQYPLLYRIGNAPVAYVTYIAKMFWPSRLAIFYPHPLDKLTLSQVARSVLLLAGITAAVICKIRRHPYLAVGWLWYLVTLVPVIGLVQVGLQASADRYTYVPLTGLFIIIAWGIPELLSRLHYRKIILSLSAAIVLSALTVTTWHQLRHWRTSITLYKHAAAVVQNNWWAYYRLGNAFDLQNKLDEAIKYLTQALRIRPDSANTHYNLAVILERSGRLDEAITHYTEVLRINPDFADIHHNLGALFAQQGKFDQAIAHFNKVLVTSPDSTEAHRNLGSIFVLQGRLDDGIKHYDEALRLKPDWPDPMNSLAWIFATHKQTKYYNPEEAIHLAERACELTKHKEPNFLDTLAAAYAAAGRFAEAVATDEKALQLAQSAAQYQLTEQIQSHLRLYKAGQPYVALPTEVTPD